MRGIEVKVVGIALLSDGDARLTLEPTDPDGDDPQELVVMQAPPNLAILFERTIWGTKDTLLCGSVKIGVKANECLCEISEAALNLVEKGEDKEPRKRKGKRK
jgi:hypothetical protein